MLPQAHRLKNSRDFDRAYKRGRHVKGTYGKMVAYKRDDDNPTRIGIVISAKRGKAFRRNRAKRQIREAIRTHLPQLKSGFDLSLIMWEVDFTFEEIQKDIREILTQSGLLGKTS